jgi:ligand-binding SRPBCC domain-containing protein
LERKCQKIKRQQNISKIMPTFDFSFVVKAPLQAVADFHEDTSTLKTLNPPFIFVQLHRVDPMANGSISEFTLWMGPLPIRWRAVHSDVSSRGFTDTQEQGPLNFWRHKHRFKTLDEDTTQIFEHIDYEYRSGIKGWLSRLIFGKLGLIGLFTYRQWATRRALER